LVAVVSWASPAAWLVRIEFLLETELQIPSVPAPSDTVGSKWLGYSEGTGLADSAVETVDWVRGWVPCSWRQLSDWPRGAHPASRAVKSRNPSQRQRDDSLAEPLPPLASSVPLLGHPAEDLRNLKWKQFRVVSHNQFHSCLSLRGGKLWMGVRGGHRRG